MDILIKRLRAYIIDLIIVILILIIIALLAHPNFTNYQNELNNLSSEYFEGKISFRHSGLSPIDGDVDECVGTSMKDQLEHFHRSLVLHGWKDTHKPESWLEAF